jgi:D-serine deaminase-like pyridoxal phosphate-dependent protein
LTVAADSRYTIDGLSTAAVARDVEVGVIIELDQGRTGVPTAEAAVELGKAVDSAPGLELRGVMIMPAPPSVRPFLREVLDAFDRAGLPHPIVSGGSTPSAFTAHEIPELTEFRAGEYPVGGVKHLELGTHTVNQCAGRVLATVVSRPNENRAVIDAGSKSLSAATASFHDQVVMGYVVEYPQARLSGASEEHGQIDLSACERKPEIGERVQVILAHPCPCFNEHDEIYALRENQVEAVWSVDARGAIR